jgi:hypothetical protein
VKRIARLMKHETAGDPITGIKWTRKTTEKIAQELASNGVQVCANTVGRLLKQMGFSLRVNHKKIESGNKNPPKPQQRDRQFEHISKMRERFARGGKPIISVDTKKKELIGNFRNGGQSWERESIAVHDHDFRSDALGIAVPFGIYDTQANQGFICVGTSAETAGFAVDAIESWWIDEGKKRYPRATGLLVLADCGGANSARSRAWKYRIQKQLCDRHHLMVTVCHFPPGASKWNPIEHRLFSEISKNWAGKPLVSFQTALQYIRTTHTTSGLQVRARLVRKKYQKGEIIPEREMNKLFLSRHQSLPDWNYIIAPSKM